MKSNRLLLRSCCHIQYQGFISFAILHLTMQVTISRYQSPTVGKSASKLCHCWAQERVDPTSSTSYFTHSWVPSSGSVLTIYRRVIPKHQQCFHGKSFLKCFMKHWNTLSSSIMVTCLQLFPETDLVPSDIRIFKNWKIKNMPRFLVTERSTPVIHT